MEKSFWVREDNITISPNVSYNLFKYLDGSKKNLNTLFQICLLDSLTRAMLYNMKIIRAIKDTI